MSQPGEPLISLCVFLQFLAMRVEQVCDLLIQLLLVFPEKVLHILLMGL
jgi:hypothetical protein